MKNLLQIKKKLLSLHQEKTRKLNCKPINTTKDYERFEGFERN